MSIFKKAWNQAMEDDEFAVAVKFFVKIWKHSIFGKACVIFCSALAIKTTTWVFIYATRSIIHLVGKIL